MRDCLFISVLCVRAVRISVMAVTVQQNVHICAPDHNNHSYSLADCPPSLFSFYPAECINLLQKNQADRNKQINIRHLQRNTTGSIAQEFGNPSITGYRSAIWLIGWPALGLCEAHFVLSVSK